ncbi:rRNA biogenesis protein rrp5 [uncultured Ruminococcus sp.]|uniref:rRNA biogenesis protein rrp5 n=1 Tax=uncultured Ruminococcus sp. TaxID=165186 RepID=UPI0026587F45|nr:rRNA biogenesis protein rrp5 [uncultured Ruminococcus sp.]
MSKEPTTLLDVIHVIRQLADKLETMAETMTEREVQTFEQVYPPEEGVQKPVSVKDTPAVSISEIRAVLAEKSRSGFTDSVKALLQKHGASKLSGVSPEEYAVLLEEAKQIGT